MAIAPEQACGGRQQVIDEVHESGLPSVYGRSLPYRVAYCPDKWPAYYPLSTLTGWVILMLAQ